MLHSRLSPGLVLSVLGVPVPCGGSAGRGGLKVPSAGACEAASAASIDNEDRGDPARTQPHMNMYDLSHSNTRTPTSRAKTTLLTVEHRMQFSNVQSRVEYTHMLTRSTGKVGGVKQAKDT